MLARGGGRVPRHAAGACVDGLWVGGGLLGGVDTWVQRLRCCCSLVWEHALRWGHALWADTATCSSRRVCAPVHHAVPVPALPPTDACGQGAGGDGAPAQDHVPRL